MARLAMTLDEVAEALGVSRRALRRHCQTDAIVFDDGRRLPILRMGQGIVRVPTAAVQQLLGAPIEAAS